MNKELIEKLKYEITAGEYSTIKTEDLETVLNYIENSIPKEVIVYKILERKFELQQEYKDFEDDIQLNTLQELLEGK